ncbi:MAG: hypothetical protein FD147_90 [Chloroflexi bacterium]|nr:MAG: hypothetical protein FD147_90 [Chloroflexota bacterium]MBA4374718.1 hypothetical protein [Anaerolinea sp.]
MPVIVLHMLNEDPVQGDVDELPQRNDTLIYVRNPRRRDGKDIPYLEANVTTVVWPMSRISFIEILPGSEDEKIVSFVRD